MPDALGASCGVGSFGAPLSWHCGGPSLVGRRHPLIFYLASLAAAAYTCASRAPAVDGEGAGRPSHAPHPDWRQVGSPVDSSVTTPAFHQVLATTSPLGGELLLGWPQGRRASRARVSPRLCKRPCSGRPPLRVCAVSGVRPCCTSTSRCNRGSCSPRGGVSRPREYRDSRPGNAPGCDSSSLTPTSRASKTRRSSESKNTTYSPPASDKPLFLAAARPLLSCLMSLTLGSFLV